MPGVRMFLPTLREIETTRRSLVVRPLTLHDAFVAVEAVAAGVLVAVLLHFVLRRLRDRAATTERNGDDLAVAALRGIAPWAAVVSGLWVAAAGLPLTIAVDRQVNRVLIAVLVLMVTVTAARVVAELVRSTALSRSGVAGSATIFVNIVRLVVLAVGILVLLQTLGVSVAPLLTALGVGGLAVALALQDTLANLFAGVHILASKKVQPGDYIQLASGENGYVVDINWRNTVVRQLPDNLVIVPNAQLASTIVINYYRPSQQMSVLVQVGVGYASDLDQVERVTIEVATDVMRTVPGGVPEHEPFIRYHTFGESSIDFSVILRAGEFTDQYLVTHEFIKRLHRRYQAEGIEIPFPIRTVVLPEGAAAPVRPARAPRSAGPAKSARSARSATPTNGPGT
jgi:small-conductance mechanosensitive channel